MSLALIAGTGRLPVVLFEQLSFQGEAPLVCALHGFEPELEVDIVVRLETLGSFLADLRSRGVTQVCMAGAVRRPAIDPSAIDAATLPMVPRLRSAMAKGDDGTLREIVMIFEEQGIKVVGASDLSPNLLPPEGVLTEVSPGPDAKRDARIGTLALAEMGAADSGQACIIKAGDVLAREGTDGTDAMLNRFRRVSTPDAESTIWPLDFAGDLVTGAADWLTGDGTDAGGGILFKGPKPNQERRVDLPVIGHKTAQAAVAANLAGIVIDAGGVMVLDLPKVVSTLDQAGLFLWVRQ